MQPADLPAIVIKDPDDFTPSDGIGKGRRDHNLAIDLTFWCSGSSSPEAVREAIKTIVAAIGEDPEFGGLAFDTILNRAAMDLAEAAMQQSAGQIDITVRYRSGLWDI